MAIKIYQSGSFLTIEQPSGNKTNLSLETYSYRLIDVDTIHFEDNQDGVPFLVTAQLSTLQDEAGTTIGSVSDVQNYLAAMGVTSTSDPNLGFALFTDTVNDINNPQQITAGNPQVLTIVAGAPFVVGGANFTPVGASLWSGNAMRPFNGNSDSYLVRLTFIVNPSGNNQSIFVKMDIGTGALIHDETISLPANRNTLSPETIKMDLFAGANFFANGGQIIIDGDGNFDIYNKAIKIEIIRKTP